MLNRESIQQNKTRTVIAALVVFFCCALALAAALFVPTGKAYAVEEGAYILDGISCDTGMVSFDSDDIPPILKVESGSYSLVVTAYNPNKFDAIWKGERVNLPADPQNAPGLILGTFIPMDSAYAESGKWMANAYKDPVTGTTYKALQFEIPITQQEYETGKIPFVLRRSPWSPSNPGKWMGSEDHYFTFGKITGPYIPAGGSGDESAETPLETIPAGGSGDEPAETPLETAKRLIAALPANPDALTESDKAALQLAENAYVLLSDADKATLDNTIYQKEQSYGRWLESAQWGVLAGKAIDNTLNVVDGDYSAYATSKSNMGKSTSQRARTWTVSKLTVSNGKAKATIRCGSSSAFKKLRIGGKSYTAKVVDGVPEFTVPIAVNAVNTFTVNASEASDSIAYQINVALPLNKANSSAKNAAKNKAKNALQADMSKYSPSTAKQVKSAANALIAAAKKNGVAVVELNVASKNLDAAVDAAKKTLPSRETKPNSKTGDNSGKVKKGDVPEEGKASEPSKQEGSAASSPKTPTGTGQSQAIPAIAAKSGNAPNAGGGPSRESVDAETDDDVVEEDEASFEQGTASGKNAAGDKAASVTGEVKTAAVGGGQVDKDTALALEAGALALMLLLAGMCARAVIFARSKGDL